MLEIVVLLFVLFVLIQIARGRSMMTAIGQGCGCLIITAIIVALGAYAGCVAVENFLHTLQR